LPFIGIFGDSARSGPTALRTAKRDSPSAQRVHDRVIAVHFLGLVHGLRGNILRPSGRPSLFNFAQTPRPLRAYAPTGAGGNGELPVNDTLRYRANAAECLSAAERCETPYRCLTLAIAFSWLSLARHQEAMDELLIIWSNAQFVKGSGANPTAIQYPREPAHGRTAAFQAPEAISA
jgi:hypothetical protein